MNTSLVLNCSVGECAYNVKLACHAQKIEVGYDHSRCDTFTAQSKVKPSEKAMPAIGQCRVAICMFNLEQKCSAPGGITVSNHMDHADCVTFVPKY